MDLSEIVLRVRTQDPYAGWNYGICHSFLRILMPKGYVSAEKRGKIQHGLRTREITRGARFYARSLDGNDETRYDKY